jgi:hypothetical protein
VPRQILPAWILVCAWRRQSAGGLVVPEKPDPARGREPSGCGPGTEYNVSVATVEYRFIVARSPCGAAIVAAAATPAAHEDHGAWNAKYSAPLYVRYEPRSRSTPS